MLSSILKATIVYLYQDLRVCDLKAEGVEGMGGFVFS